MQDVALLQACAYKRRAGRTSLTSVQTADMRGSLSISLDVCDVSPC